MSVHVASWAWRVSLDGLEGLTGEHRVAAHVARTVVAKLADNANDEGEAWPSIATIAYETELGERTVKRSLAALEKIGVIRRRVRPRRSTVYVLQMGSAELKPPRTGAAPAPLTNTRKGAADDTSGVPLTTIRGAAPAPRTTKELPEEQPPREGGADPLEIQLALTVELGREPLTASEKRDWRRVVLELVAVDATANDVQARCASYRQIWPSARLTPIALVRHWSMLGSAAELNQPGSSLNAWVENTAWQLPTEAVLDILESRGIAGTDSKAVLDRCAEIAEQHRRVSELTDALLDRKSA